MWTDWLPNGDFTEAIMASSFDWNGQKGSVCICNRKRHIKRNFNAFCHTPYGQSAVFPRRAHILVARLGKKSNRQKP
ncbi:MAG: hypothetical protein L6V93_05675 [Clostridiales bacterium]|nr:MAG: hypothetical protein L6V93_05675 [Clostridiales bacterium]